MSNIRYLAKTFKEHSQKLIKDREERLAEFKERYPDDPIPEFLADDFNLPEALAIICEEILCIKSAKRV